MGFGPRFLLSSILLAEDYVVKQILRSPTFHRTVQRIHDRVHDRKYGRNPHEPLRQGEATREQLNKEPSRFWAYFFEEIRNQIRGK